MPIFNLIARMNRALFFLFALLIHSSLTMAAPQKSALIGIKVSSTTEQFTLGQPFPVSIQITNNGKSTIEVFEPQLLQTLTIELVSGNTVVKPFIKADSPPPEKIKIASGKTFLRKFDLSTAFPLPVKGGDYNLRVTYFYDVGFKVSTNDIKVQIKQLSAEEQEIFDASLKVLQAGENATVARLGQEFLAKYPDSAFSNQVRLEAALPLIQMGQQDQAIALYKQILDSDEQREWIKEEARGYLWQAYADKGDIPSAIAVLEKIGGDYAKSNIAFVKRLNGSRIFEPPPPEPEAKAPTESVDEMDIAEAPPTQAATEIEKLETQWNLWVSYANGKGYLNNVSPVFDNENFVLIQRQGANGVKFVLDKVERRENLGELFSGGFGILSIMPRVSKTSFHFIPVATPENSKLIVYRCEEFPTMEIGRRTGQERELWLKWWAEKDAKIPIWFRGRYQMWKTAKAGADKAKTEAAYRKTVDLGIFALPQWMEKLQSDTKESKAIINAISELSSGEVAPDATPPQVKAWWKTNKNKWTKVTLDDVATPAQ